MTLTTDEKFLKLLREQGHIGQSHGKAVQVHIEFKDVQERNYWLGYELPCPACEELFNPCRNINSFAYGRRKSYIAYGCKGMQCHRDKACLEVRNFIIKYVENNGPEWRCAPNIDKPGIEFEKIHPNNRPSMPWWRFNHK